MKSRFMKYVCKTEACWTWTGCKMVTGYGRFNIEGKIHQAHRVSAHLFKAFDLKSSLFVCHHCDNKQCVNPSHLFIGTAKDNIRDGVSKGIMNRSHPRTSNPRARLTTDDTGVIKDMYASGVSVREIAALYDISVQPIYRILTNKHWSTLCV